MNDDSQYLFYICGGRSFHKANPGRKIYEVVRTWRQLGFEIDHVCGADVPAVATTESESNSSSTVARSWKNNSKLKSLFPALAHSLSERRDILHDKQMLATLRAMSAKRKPDLIWERSSRLHSAGLQLAREIGVPFVLEWKDHLVDYDRSLYRKRALKTETQKNQEADWIVVESNILKTQLQSEGIDGSKIIVAHNAIDPDEFRANEDARISQRKALGVDEKTVLVGYLGSYAFYHNTELLAEAASLVDNSQVRFVLIGEGLEEEKTRDLAGRLGVLDKNLVMLPRIKMEQVPAVLCALDIAVLPGSTDIICPIKIQEYMASGTVTIAPDYPCNREVVSNDDLGVLFEPDNANDLAGVIDVLAEDADLRQSIGNKGRDHVANEFTWDATWGRALQDILKSTNSERPTS